MSIAIDGKIYECGKEVVELIHSLRTRIEELEGQLCKAREAYRNYRKESVCETSADETHSLEDYRKAIEELDEALSSPSICRHEEENATLREAVEQNEMMIGALLLSNTGHICIAKWALEKIGKEYEIVREDEDTGICLSIRSRRAGVKER